MRILCSIFLITILTQCRVEPEPPHSTSDLYSQIMDPNALVFDSTLSNALRPDPYGMKQYILAYLKAGPNRSQDSITAAELQQAHLANIMRMAEEEKLVLAGPFLDDGDVRGIYVFNTSSMEDARAWTNSDPAVQAGRLIMELHPFYCTAVLPLINPLSKRVTRQNIAD
ncbi:MAG: YciI family protein [Saprospiraceae bacterium]